MFTSKEFNAFMYTAEERSITQAANRLFLTPPSVCSMVKKLEKRINKSLFAHTDGSMTLTNEGNRLFDSLRPLFYALKDIEGQQRKQEKNHLLIYLHNDFYFISGKLTCFFMKNGIKTTIVNAETQDADISILRHDPSASFDAQIELNFFNASVTKNSQPQPLIISDKIKSSCWFPGFSAEIREQHGDYDEIVENNANTSIDLLQAGLGRICVPELSPKYPLIARLNGLNLVRMKIKALAGANVNKNLHPEQRVSFLNFLSDLHACSEKQHQQY